MPTENPRVTFAITPDLLAEINAYRYDHRIRNQSQAVLQLIRIGLSAEEGASRELPEQMKDRYAALDAHGRRMVQLVLNEEYVRCREQGAHAVQLCGEAVCDGSVELRCAARREGMEMSMEPEKQT